MFLVLDDNEELIYDLGWFVGFFDGEGCISINKDNDSPSVNISITNKQLWTLEKCMEILKKINIESKIHIKKKENDDFIYILRIIYSGIPNFIKLFDCVELSGNREKKFSELKKFWKEREEKIEKINMKKPSEEELSEMYIIKKMSPYRIARICNVNHITIRNWLKIYGIKMRSYEESKSILTNNLYKRGVYEKKKR